MSIETDDPVALRASARQARRAFERSQEGKHARVIAEAVREYLAARANGVSREDGVKGLEEVLRSALPCKRSKFRLCEACEGGGWRITDCTHARRCGRYSCSISEPEYEHTYAVPCDCVDGDKYRRRSLPPSEDETLTTVGRQKRQKRQGGWRQIGS
jgi:hypothetical protein